MPPEALHGTFPRAELTRERALITKPNMLWAQHSDSIGFQQRPLSSIFDRQAAEGISTSKLVAHSIHMKPNE